MTYRRLTQAGVARITQAGDERVLIAIYDYVVQYRTTAGPGEWITFSDAYTGTTGATVTGLTNSTSYDFRIAAVSELGRGSWSNIYTATPSGPVTPHEILDTTGTVTTTATTDVAQFRDTVDTTVTTTADQVDLWRDQQLLDTTITATTTDTTDVKDLKATVASSWGTWTGTADGVVTALPSFNAPANVVATATGKTTITVTWDAVATALSYDIERDSVVIVYDHPASPYNDTGLSPDTLYSYRVRAVK